MNSEIFRFLTVRPAQRVDTGRIEANSIATHSQGDSSSFLAELKNARDQADARAAMTATARRYAASAEFVGSLLDVPLSLSAFDDWVASVGGRTGSVDASEGATRALGEPPGGLVAGAGYRAARRQVGDSLLAASIVCTGPSHTRPELMRAMRLMGLLERIAAGPALERGEAIRQAMNATVLLPD